MASKTDTKTVITLKGSVAIVSEFFHTAINSILYQRGIYQPETFRRESKYGLTVLTTTDQGLLEYMNNVMGQMEHWLTDGDVQRLVVVVTGVDSGETLERWQFNVNVEEKKKGAGGTGTTAMDVDSNVGNENDASVSNAGAGAGNGKTGEKSIKEVHNEIQAIIRQITASVSSFLAFFLIVPADLWTNNGGV
jgi:mitotic spindle assembly checkpoint protein MAD2